MNKIVVLKKCHKCSEQSNLIECRNLWNSSIIPDFYSCQEHIDEYHYCFACGRVKERCECFDLPIMFLIQNIELVMEADNTKTCQYKPKTFHFAITDEVDFACQLNNVVWQFEYDDLCSSEYQSSFKIGHKNLFLSCSKVHDKWNEFYLDTEEFLKVFNFLKNGSKNGGLIDIDGDNKLQKLFCSEVELTIDMLKEIVYE